MKPALLLAATALIAAQASADGNSSLDLTITSANGGTDSTFSWSISGPVSTNTGLQINAPVAAFSGIGINASLANSSTSNTGWAQGSLTQPFTVTGLSTGLIMHNYTQGTSAELTTFMLMESFGNYTVSLKASQNLSASYGDYLGYSGTLSGSFTFSKAYSFFNSGYWSVTSAGMTNSLTIGSGAPVPEPSTYGLALCGLALVAVALRRRNKTKA